MFSSLFDLRRLSIAVIISIFALVWVAKTEETATTSTSSTTFEDGAVEPIILGGPEPIVQSGSAQIAYPATDTTGKQALASFSNFNSAPDIVCYFPQAPLGIALNVKNLNNGRSASCTNVFRTSIPAGITMLIHTKVFQSLSNLVDAPIPVVVSW